MLKKIQLFYQIRKFYNIFGDEVGNNFITKLSDMTTDNVHDVLFDLNEIRDTYEDGYCIDDMGEWLDKLQNQIFHFCYKTPITINSILFHICNTKRHGFYELRPFAKPIYKFAQWLYTKGV